MILLFLRISQGWGASMLKGIDEVHDYAPKYTHTVRLMLGGDDRLHLMVRRFAGTLNPVVEPLK